MSKKFNLSGFCVIPNAEHWTEYQDQVAENLDSRAHDVNFPPSPKKFPCLVASKVKAAAGGSKEFEVDSCFVYEDDAKLLLSAGVDHRREFEKSVDEMLAEPPWTAGMEYPDGDMVPTIEPDLSILVLSMLRELVDVGAIKPSRLFGQLQPMSDKLQAFHKAGVDPDSSVADFIKDLWKAVNKDAS
tara:strand:- start:2838 stop:3395 length:558 start_codon:yes stop_codon:yes gene_type:complete